MSAEELYLLISALLCVPLMVFLPKSYAADAVAAWTFVSLSILSPLTSSWLLLSTLGTVAIMRYGGAQKIRCPLHAVWGITLIAGLLIPREIPTLVLVGSAYFTLRNLHILIDSHLHQIPAPGYREVIQYQFFGPVMMVGPIHRLPSFTRSLQRRRFDRLEVAVGAERALVGLALATMLGGYLIGSLLILSSKATQHWLPFFAQWITSALEWVQLYFVFSGLSSVAIGLALMMGIRIEENFNHPYRASSLLDFWTRWHITLSLWCRDYVFQPLSSITRQPLIGLAAAMVTIGIWHETSMYYLLWGFWQVLGIVLNRLILKAWPESWVSIPQWIKAIFMPILILGWLSLAKPVITLLLGIER